MGGVVEMAKPVLMIVAPVNFRDEECLRPKAVLQGIGSRVTIASKGVRQARGMLGATLAVDKDIADVNVSDYAAVVFVGGSGASVYFNDPRVISIAKQASREGKIIGAICIAPSILANAGLLQGRKATAYPSEEQNLRAKGAIYTGEDVTVDGKIITAKGPHAAAAFGEALAKALK